MMACQLDPSALPPISLSPHSFFTLLLQKIFSLNTNLILYSCSESFDSSPAALWSLMDHHLITLAKSSQLQDIQFFEYIILSKASLPCIHCSPSLENISDSCTSFKFTLRSLRGIAFPSLLALFHLEVATLPCASKELFWFYHGSSQSVTCQLLWILILPPEHSSTVADTHRMHRAFAVLTAQERIHSLPLTDGEKHRTSEKVSV